ncbi:hypothetical protein JL107_11270 [Nakamurella flavida]|uniref:Putative Flp pilus-assembly TadG-like N-terminal domain-containing protein n=1 Tax=Nakamurella flavida TaxID=363630 RepID=A0A939C5L8_9ACTN|nr:pilus assembly protein TadG-related protein [Nakamurella flavida]MBM9477029.1 hypothetical protein [Nakamurella flavida]MDP9779975.1 hypothetical protein [Nakamurella flavida]
MTPLIIGMTACLLILSMGVTAAGSAFLAGRRLQNLCDGAATAAVGAVDRQRYAAEGAGQTLPLSGAAGQRVREYLQLRGTDVRATTRVGDGAVTVACSNDAPITFGFLVGSPTIPRYATSTARPSL